MFIYEDLLSISTILIICQAIVSNLRMIIFNLKDLCSLSKFSIKIYKFIIPHVMHIILGFISFELNAHHLIICECLLAPIFCPSIIIMMIIIKQFILSF